jgi:hypothetical protein
LLSSKCRFNGAQLWKEFNDDCHKPTFVCMSARFPISVETLSTHFPRVQKAIASAFFSSGHQNEGSRRVEVVSVEDISAGFSEIMVSFKIRVPDKNAPSEFPNLEAASLVLAKISASTLNPKLVEQGLADAYKIARIQICGNETVGAVTVSTSLVTATPAPAT